MNEKIEERIHKFVVSIMSDNNSDTNDRYQAVEMMMNLKSKDERIFVRSLEQTSSAKAHEILCELIEKLIEENKTGDNKIKTYLSDIQNDMTEFRKHMEEFENKILSLNDQYISSKYKEVSDKLREVDQALYKAGMIWLDASQAFGEKIKRTTGLRAGNTGSEASPLPLMKGS